MLLLEKIQLRPLTSVRRKISDKLAFLLWFETVNNLEKTGTEPISLRKKGAVPHFSR
jgi:hypothetical protein